MTTRGSSDSERLERIERLVEGIASDQTAVKADISDLKTDVGMLKTDVAVLKTDVAMLKTDVGMLKTDVATLKTDMSDVKAELSILKGDVGVLKTDMSVMKGWQTELAVERRVRDVFRRLCRGHLLRVYPDEELHHYVREHTNAGAMSSDDASRAESIDFLIEGTDASGAAVMFALEVSYAVGVSDCDRAIGKAVLLTSLLGREVKPAVVGEVFATGFEAYAGGRNVAYTYIGNGNEIVR